MIPAWTPNNSIFRDWARLVYTKLLRLWERHLALTGVCQSKVRVLCFSLWALHEVSSCSLWSTPSEHSDITSAKFASRRVANRWPPASAMAVVAGSRWGSPAWWHNEWDTGSWQEEGWESHVKDERWRMKNEGCVMKDDGAVNAGTSWPGQPRCSAPAFTAPCARSVTFTSNIYVTLGAWA